MTKVLFVDDEPRVLEGLRLSLRVKRKAWQMVFVENGADALAEVEREPVDVVVSDMRMPGMDGAAFLARVQLLRPEAVRIVLSGQTDESAASRAASVAHRFLTKPCDSAVLEATISRALELNEWLHSDRLRKSIGGLENLPSLPSTYLDLTQTLANPDSTIHDVARIIQRDVGMAAKILQLVNSAFFGLSRSIVSVTEAVSYLGVNTMKGLVLAHSVFQTVAPGNSSAIERLQRHALLTARFAKRLPAEKRAADAAFTAALLHDVGRLALESRLPEECAANRADAKRLGLLLHQAERERLGVTHADVGAYLLGLWGLPHDIIEAVARHHDAASEFTVLDVGAAVRIADAIAAEFDESSKDFEGLPESELKGLLERFGLSAVVAELRADGVHCFEGRPS